MQLEQLERLFHPFGRVVTDETANIDGEGLGLYIAQELARLQGGKITDESDHGRGSKFRLSIPLVVSEALPIELTAGVQH